MADDILKALDIDRSSSVVVANLIRESKMLNDLNHVGLAELVLTGGWFVWWERRKFVHRETIQDPTRAAMSIATLMTNYKRSVKKTAKKRGRWKKPLEGNLLLNVDGSYNPDRSTGGTDAIIRDSRGSFIAAASCFIEHVVDAAMVEAIAFKEGLMLAQLIGCS